MCSVELAESRQVSEPKSEVSRKVSGARGEQSEAEELKSQRDREHTISGDYSLRVPPVPIPNTEVKPQHADGTWLETARESRSSPDSTVDALKASAFLCIFSLGTGLFPLIFLDFWGTMLRNGYARA